MISPMLLIPAAIKIVPRSREVYAGDCAFALAAGQTAQAQGSQQTCAALAGRREARMQDAYLQLLLGASGDAAESSGTRRPSTCRKGAAKLAGPGNPRTGMPSFERKRGRVGRNPRAAGNRRRTTGRTRVPAAILAANGREDGARNDAQPPQRETALARRTRSHRSAAAITVASAVLSGVGARCCVRNALRTAHATALQRVLSIVAGLVLCKASNFVRLFRASISSGLIRRAALKLFYRLGSSTDLCQEQLQGCYARRQN